MKSMRDLSGRVLLVGWSGILAFLITAYGEGIWGVLIAINVIVSPVIPWAVPVMAVLLWVLWQYLGGKWWPHSTSEARRHYLRARLVPGKVFVWVLLAGILSIIALTGLWIVMFQLVKMPANVLPEMSGYPLVVVALVLVMASLAAPLTEEAAFRGYCQVMLEREFPGPVAIVISSVFFALAHLTQGGFLWPKLLVYFFAGMAFGVTAYLTKSILPGMVIHFMGDMTFFALVWPYDAARPLVWDSGADAWFWIHVAQAIIFTTLAILAFKRLAAITKEVGANRDKPDYLDPLLPVELKEQSQH